MDNPTLPEYLERIKYAFNQQEQLTQTLFKAETQIELVLDQDLTTFSRSKLHDCHLILSDLIQKAKGLSEMVMTALLTLKETLH